MWKSEAIRNSAVFSAETVVAKDEIPTEKLYARIGQLIWRMTLKKSLLVSISERVKMVDTQNKLSIVKQCIKKFIVAVFIKQKTGKFRELENNAITRPTVF
jgi:hypothetical protein